MKVQEKNKKGDQATHPTQDYFDIAHFHKARPYFEKHWGLD